jgi:hypothetical protein
MNFCVENVIIIIIIIKLLHFYGVFAIVYLEKPVDYYYYYYYYHYW